MSRRGLPDVPERPVGAYREDFKASIGILPHVRNIDCVQIGGLTQGSPTAPNAIRSDLPEMPERSISANGKDFESSISILCYRGKKLGVCYGCGWLARG